MTHVELFAGIGGISVAARRAGFDERLLCERDPHCQRVLAKHWPGVPIVGDVRELTGDVVRDACGGAPTLVSGGFPCQPFSSAGKRKGRDDDRFLWPEFCRVVRESRPRWVLGENVRGLLSVSDGRVFGSILGDLADLGYVLWWGCYGADEACGASHRRDRVFIVGRLADANGGIPRIGPRVGTRADDGPSGDRERGMQAGDRGGGPELAHPGLRPGRPEHGEQLADAGHERPRRDNPQDGRQPGRRRNALGEPSPRNCSLADPDERGRRTIGPRPGEAPTDGRRIDVADAELPGHRHGVCEPEPRGAVADCRPFAFPPAPNDFDRWRRVLAVRPDLAPALTLNDEYEYGISYPLTRRNTVVKEEAESEIRRVADGVSGGLALTRRQKLKMLGNAVVPDQIQPILDAIAEAVRGQATAEAGVG